MKSLYSEILKCCSFLDFAKILEILSFFWSTLRLILNVIILIITAQRIILKKWYDDSSLIHVFPQRNYKNHKKFVNISENIFKLNLTIASKNAYVVLVGYNILDYYNIKTKHNVIKDKNDISIYYFNYYFHYYFAK